MKRREEVLVDLSNQRVVTQHCPGDTWKSCIYFEKVSFNRSVAAVEKHGYCELLFVVVNDPTCPSLLTVFPRSTLTGLLKHIHGAVRVSVKIPLPCPTSSSHSFTALIPCLHSPEPQLCRAGIYRLQLHKFSLLQQLSNT